MGKGVFEMNKTELAAKSISELKALAEKIKVKLPARAKKAAIIDILLEAAGPKKGALKKSAKAVGKRATKRRTVSDKTAETPEKWVIPSGVEEPLMAQERVEDAKYYTGKAVEGGAAQHTGLPHAYGEDRIVLMVRDPYWVFAYWEIDPARIDREKAWFGLDSRLAVRIYDITGVHFDGANANGFYDQEVYDRVGDWYFDLGRPSHSFCADIGLLSSEGRFLTLARSNYITMPRDGASDVIDEEWMSLEEEYARLYGFPAGSSPYAREWARRRQLLEITSPGMFGRERSKRR